MNIELIPQAQQKVLPIGTIGYDPIIQLDIAGEPAQFVHLGEGWWCPTVRPEAPKGSLNYIDAQENHQKWIRKIPNVILNKNQARYYLASEKVKELVHQMNYYQKLTVDNGPTSWIFGK